MRKKAIIVDLDGTLCNTDHRKHLVEAKKWDAFYDALVDDSLNNWCWRICRSMGHDGYPTVFVSGRPYSHEEQTRAWLSKHDIPFVDLFMRTTGDFRKDSIVKEEIYRHKIAPQYNILFCLDDRKQVVNMWRSIGLTCLQCAEGNF